MKKITPAQARKAIIALVAFVGQLVSAGVLPASAQPYVAAFIAACAAVGVFVVPNAEAPSED